MLETVDLGAKLGKDAYKDAIDPLDIDLAELQRRVKDAGIPVLVVFEGWDAAGKGSVLSRLLQPLDPRAFQVYNIGAPTEEERFYPAMWRFWNALPDDGLIALYNHSWYRQVLQERVEAKASAAELAEAFERIRSFERQLADHAAVIVKFFLHISKKEQAKRFKKLTGDPAFAWKVGKEEKRRHKQYDDMAAAIEDMLAETSTAQAPWTLVPATQQRFACVRVAETLAYAMRSALDKRSHAPAEPPAPAPRRTSALDRADLSLSVDKDGYDEQLPKLQEELRRLQHLCYVKRTPVVLVYEGWDAAGKGGNIRRLTRELDPRGYDVVPIAAPTGSEKTHHYLWRFWRALPKAGHIAVFDRSWYGRVLVERVEGFAEPAEWQRAFREINEFEGQLAEFGAVVAKFWVHISKDEQLRRFEDRQNTPHKQWKITEEDWRNREQWDAYWTAVSDMVERTSTVHAPWTIIEGNDKRHARLQALRTVIERVRTAVKD